MYPLQVSQDYVTLVHGTPQWKALLERYEDRVVVGTLTLPLTALMWRHPTGDSSTGRWW